MAVLVLIGGCSKDYDLNKSIFIPDKEYPELPAYSEKGFNTFGALIDREPFVCSDLSVPAKVISTGGLSTFSLRGHKGRELFSYYRAETTPVVLEFDLPGFEPAAWSDMAALHKMEIDLTDPGYRVWVTFEAERHEVSLIKGSLEFRRVQILIVDKEPYEAIVSGTFDLQGVIDGEPTSISMGRFDVGIADDNFFRY